MTRPGHDAQPRRVTLRDVAKRAAVSPSAASAALRGDGRLHSQTRARILAAADELGYRRNSVARSLRTSAEGVVATVMHSMPTEESLRRPKSFWEQAVFGYVQELATAEIGNVFIPAADSSMLSRLPADVVVVFNLPQDGKVPSLCVPYGTPTLRVVSATELDESNDSSARIIWDYHAALGAVLTHLAEAGSRQPGLLLPPKPLMPTSLIRQAHEDWCGANGRDVLLSESIDIAAGAEDLLARGCDGFVVHGDDAAGDVEHVLETVRATGLRVPHDVLVASISDGRREALMRPAVTCLTYDGIASGSHIAGAVIRGLREGVFRDVTIGWRLEVRDSSNKGLL